MNAHDKVDEWSLESKIELVRDQIAQMRAKIVRGEVNAFEGANKCSW